MRLAPLLLAASTRALRLTRRGVIAAPAAVAAPALAFDGQAYAGRTPQAAEMMDGLEIPEDRRHCALLCEDAMTALAARIAQALSGQDRQAL